MPFSSTILQVTPGTLRSGTNNTQFISLSSPPPRVMAGNLYHIVASYDGTTAKLYVNGTLVNSFVTPYQPVVTPVNLTIASRNGNNYTHAVLDDVALYNYALSPSQIANHYGLGRSGTLAATIVSNPVPASIKSVVGVPQSFRAMASGQAPLALQWLKNGVPVPGATAQTLTLPSVQLSDAGSYSLRASNAVAGAVTSAPAVLTVANQPFLVHRWSFDDGTDSVSGSNATLFGSASYSGGQLVLLGWRSLWRVMRTSISDPRLPQAPASRSKVGMWTTLPRIGRRCGCLVSRLRTL